MAKLTFILDDGQEIEVPLEERISIGRRDGHDVVVDDMRISSDHAEVRRSGSEFLVRDMGSKGGTFVNDVRIDELRLRDGDRLRFGPLKAVFDGEGQVQEQPTTSRRTKAKVSRKISKKAVSATRAPAKEKPSTGNGASAAAPAVAMAVPAPPPIPMLDAESGEAALIALRASSAELQGQIQQLVNQRTELQILLHEEQGRLQGAKQELSAVEARLRDASQELQIKTGRVAQLMADEQRLELLQNALKDVEAKHGEWMAAINGLVADHERKSAEVVRLTAASEAALREAEVVSAHKKEALEHLESLSKERDLALKEREASEERLAALRKTVADAEKKAQEMQSQLQERTEGLRGVEKELQQLDERRTALMKEIAAHASTAENLRTAAAELDIVRASKLQLEEKVKELGAQHKEHQVKLSDIVKGIEEHARLHADAEARVAGIKQRLAEEEQALIVHQSKAEAARNQIEAERTAAEGALNAVRGEHAAETRRLEETRLKREEIDRQIQELAAVEDKLHQTRIVLQKVEGQRTETEAIMKVLEEKKSFLHTTIDGLSAEEGTTRGRLEVLRGREKDLRQALDELSQREQEERERFEEIRRLSVEADKEHAAQKEQLQRSIDLTRRELGDLELKLAPLREWKDAMDQRYEKLAALPEDSTEARELWREIEAEKSNLRKLITSDAGQTRGITLSEAVLRGMADNEGKPDAAEPGAPVKSAGRLHAPVNYQEGDTPEERANVGPTGTGAMLSGAGQEMALRARLSKLRESVQREATRLEFLRQERSRDEARGRAGAAGNESLMKEHERQLESKIRREEEKFATIQRKLEMAEMEEERRRDRIAEMERKLAEIKADIADAERERSDARHKMEIAHAELKSLEDAAERLKKMGEN